MVYLYLYQRLEKYKEASTFEVLSKLETDGKFGPNNLEGLQEIARDIDRRDLENKVKAFAKRRSRDEKKANARAQVQRTSNVEGTSGEMMHLRGILEATIGQMSSFSRQVEALKKAIDATAGRSQRAKASVHMHMQDACKTAERLARTLSEASRELETGGADSSGSDSSPEGTLERMQHHVPHYDNTSMLTVQLCYIVLERCI